MSVEPPMRSIAPGIAGFPLVTPDHRSQRPRVTEIDTSEAQWRIRTGVAIERLIVRRLRAMRKLAGLRQGAVAARLGRPQSFIAKIEVGNRNLLLHELVLICVVLKRDPCELLATVMKRPNIRALINAVPPFSEGMR